MKALAETFLSSGFDLSLYANLKAEEIKELVKKLADNWNTSASSDSKIYNSMVICILSHGDLGPVVFGIDGKEVNVDSLKWLFTGKTGGKPVGFIIQACQGDIAHKMQPLLVDQNDYNAHKIFVNNNSSHSNLVGK